MQVKIISEYVDDLETHINRFLRDNKYNIIEILYFIGKGYNKAVIHYYTLEEMRQLKIDKILEPKVTHK